MKTPYELFGDEGILKSGWADLVKPLVLYCNEHGIQITQIKEKFGTLRFYTGPATDALFDMVDDAETKSGKICYECGGPGTWWGLGWNMTLCRKHAIEHYGEDELLAYEEACKERDNEP